jgi:hypothetical protein
MIIFRPTALTSFSFALALGVGLGACGSSSNGSPGGGAGTNGSVGGNHGSGGAGGAVAGSGGTTGGGGTTGASTCPPCLVTLVANCIPSGTCTEQSSPSSATGVTTDNICYSNGVKDAVTDTVDATSGTITFNATITKSGATCFTEDGSFDFGAGGGSGSTSISFTIKNASGAVVATLTEDTATGVTTVSCGGQSYPLDNSCGMTMPSTGGSGGSSGTSCTQTTTACP